MDQPSPILEVPLAFTYSPQECYDVLLVHNVTVRSKGDKKMINVTYNETHLIIAVSQLLIEPTDYLIKVRATVAQNGVSA